MGKVITGKEIRNKAWLTVYEENDQYVYASDYEALQAELAKTQAEIERLREALIRILHGWHTPAEIERIAKDALRWGV